MGFPGNQAGPGRYITRNVVLPAASCCSSVAARPPVEQNIRAGKSKEKKAITFMKISVVMRGPSNASPTSVAMPDRSSLHSYRSHSSTFLGSDRTPLMPFRCAAPSDRVESRYVHRIALPLARRHRRLQDTVHSLRHLGSHSPCAESLCHRWGRSVDYHRGDAKRMSQAGGSP